MTDPRINPPWSDADEIGLRRMYAQGLPLPEIARRLGRARTTVSRRRKMAGLPDRLTDARTLHTWTDADQALAVSMLADGHSLREIGRRIGCAATTVADRLKAARIDRPLSSARTGRQFRQRLLSVLGTTGPSTVTRLAGNLRRERTTVDGHLRRLHQEGAVAVVGYRCNLTGEFFERAPVGARKFARVWHTQGVNVEDPLPLAPSRRPVANRQGAAVAEPTTARRDVAASWI